MVPLPASGLFGVPLAVHAQSPRSDPPQGRRLIGLNGASLWRHPEPSGSYLNDVAVAGCVVDRLRRRRSSMRRCSRWPLKAVPLSTVTGAIRALAEVSLLILVSLCQRN